MTALAFTVFVSSVLGSLHCAGMCGGLVAVYAGGPASDAAAKRWTAHAAYSLARLAAYAALGAGAGALGGAVDLAGAWAGLERAAAVTSGVLIVAWGLHGFLQARGWRVPAVPAPAFLRRAALRAASAIGGRPPVARGAILGLASAALPCGWLYAFVVTAAGTGSASKGALLMAAFWSGTLPAMLSVGEAVRALAGPLRRHVPAACALVLMVVGLVAVFHRASLASPPPADAGRAPACHAGR